MNFHNLAAKIKPGVNHTLFFLILLLAFVLRFYNLEWDEGYFFHPDERNIAGGVVNLDPATGDFNPNFFAYGTLPIYMIRIFSGGNFEQAIIVGRVLSAIASLASVALSLFIVRAALPKRYRWHTRFGNIDVIALAASFVVAITPGMIQFAHYATFESFLTLEYLILTYLAIRLSHSGSWASYIGLGIITGVTVATKIVSLAMLPVLIIVHGYYVLHKRKAQGLALRRTLLELFFGPKLWLLLLLAFVGSVAFAPFNILDYEAFRGSMNYESGVARGTILVFYIQQFRETIPVIYQLLRVFPYILGWPFTILGFLTLTAYTFKGAKAGISFIIGKVSHIAIGEIVVVLVTCAYLIFHLSVFVKWSRYMVPALPFLVILAIFGLNWLLRKPATLMKKAMIVILAFSIVYTAIQGLNFFTIYLQRDPRVLASEYASANLDVNAQVLSEVYDMGIVPFNAVFVPTNIKLINFYDLDLNDHLTPERWEEFETAYQNAEYIIVPSNRIYPLRLRLPQDYPRVYQYYYELFTDQTEFRLVASFSRSTWLEKLITGGQLTLSTKVSPFSPDESFKVFDQPTVLIFARQ